MSLGYPKAYCLAEKTHLGILFICVIKAISSENAENQIEMK